MRDKKTKALPSVFIDIDDTLLDFHKAEAVALTKTLTDLRIEARPETLARYSRINELQWKLLEQGLRTRDEVLTGRFEILFGELGAERSGARARELYEGYLAIGHYFIDGAEELLQELCGKYALYIASNGTASVQAGRMESAGITRYFRQIFVSEQLGYNKPSAQFFERCFEKIPGFDRAAAIIVGDSLSSDIQGGLNAGIKTCWYNPGALPNGAWLRPDYEIRALRELPALLEKLFTA